MLNIFEINYNVMYHEKMVDYVISLGRLCHTSNTLKNMGLKKFSCPFDWIFTNPSSIKDCLNTDFEVFLDKSYHVRKGFQSTHTKYQFDQCPTFFHHDITSPNVYDYFVRCVNRFRKVLNSPNHKVFITTIVNVTSYDDIDEYKAINTILANKTTDYKYIVIYTKVTGRADMEILYEDDIFKVYLQSTEKPSNGLIFESDIDTKLYASIILQFPYNLKHEV